jgi:hypothetical protein
MAEAKLRIKLGDLEFEGEGDSGWLSERLDTLIERAPSLLHTANPAPPKTDTVIAEKQAPMEPDPSIASKPLGTFLKEKKVGDNQTKKFLATAVWLESRGQSRLKTGDVTKALSDNNQSKLGNPSQCLADNVKQGYCERDKKQFYVTPQGKESLEAGGAQTGDS